MERLRLFVFVALATVVGFWVSMPTADAQPWRRPYSYDNHCDPWSEGYCQWISGFGQVYCDDSGHWSSCGGRGYSPYGPWRGGYGYGPRRGGGPSFNFGIGFPFGGHGHGHHHHHHH